MTIGVPAPGVEFSAERAEIMDAYLAALRLDNSVLTASGVVEELIAQVNSVLDDVVGRILAAEGPDSMEPAGTSRLLAFDIGTSRAQRGIHPVESLRAATTLFETTLPVLIRRFAPNDGLGAMRISRILHESIMDRVALASLSYVKLLLDKLQASRREERVRIARELHDRVLHSMGLTLQQLDLYRHAALNGQPNLAKIDAAIGSLAEAVRSVQQLTAELRRSIGNGGLEPALRAYMRENVPDRITVTLTVRGDCKGLPADIAEELYLIVREAARNAVKHADPTNLVLRVDVDNAVVNATVTDDGAGFDPTDRDRFGGGLPSMQERAQLLNGRITMTSQVGSGTTVEVSVPLPDSFR
ncbi:sensor histidine kinase [Luedemannella flava]|uniref:sensor histidine kinase n=1 Tax=Luedemannella flava TaxID=349316 RepID=UPI0031D2CEFA